MDSTDEDFADTKALFDEDIGKTFDIPKHLPPEWPQDKADRFMDYYAESIEEEVTKEMRKEATSAVPTAAQVIELLRNTDFTSIVSVGKLLDKCMPADLKPDPDPILLGTMDHGLYLLECHKKYYRRYTPKDDRYDTTGDYRPRIVEFKSQEPPPRSAHDTAIQYGLCLGTLSFVPNASLGNPNSAILLMTPFDVWLDVVSRQIWLLFNLEHYLNEEDDDPLDIVDVWEHVPTESPWGEGEIYDTIQICHLDDLVAVDIFDAESMRDYRDRPLFNDDQPKYHLKLRPYSVTEDKLNAAIAAYVSSKAPDTPMQPLSDL